MDFSVKSVYCCELKSNDIHDIKKVYDLEIHMTGYNKILLALDFFDHTDVLCTRVKDLSGRFNSDVHYIHVVEPVLSGFQDELSSIEPLGLEQELLKTSLDRLEQFGERYDVQNSNLHVELGSAKKEILRVASELNIDLLVTGSHGRHGIGLLLGSTANGLLHGAECDVLAIRLKEN
jgi:universal stress protein A